MKNLHFILILLSIVFMSCGNESTKKNDSIIGMEFQKFNQIKQLSNYIKISDTVVYENNFEPKHGILHLRDKTNNLIVLKSITLNSKNKNRIFKILDTLIIRNLDKPELITIGYCEINNNIDVNLISIVDKTDSLHIQSIKKVWKANIISEKFEIVNDISRINCLNEWFVKQ